jgi:hypothetical protein
MDSSVPRAGVLSASPASNSMLANPPAAFTFRSDDIAHGN